MRPRFFSSKSLFTTIFFWFLLATGAIFLVALGSLYFISQTLTDNTLRKNLTFFLDQHGETVVEYFLQEGPRETRRYLRELQKSFPEYHVLLTDPRGNPLFPGRENRPGMAPPMLPPPEHHMLEKILKAPEEILFFRHTAVAARKYSSPGGELFVAVIARKPSPLDQHQSATAAVRTLFLLGISLLFSYGLTRHLTKPIRELQKVAKHLGEGELSARVPASIRNRRDELGSLGTSFNAMAEQLDHLLSHQKRLLRDISHELRSPLARLRIALEIARQKGSPELDRSFNRMEEETLRMDRMVGELLSLSRMEAEASEAPRRSFSLQELLTPLREDALFEAQQKGLDVRFRLPEKDISLKGFPELLRSALENVLRNALRHTPPQGSVTLELSEETLPGEAVIRIKDSGPGVPEEELAKLFTPFYRVDTARTPQGGGTGLGLAIAERGVRLHGGTITAENRPEGGLLVEIRVPLE